MNKGLWELAGVLLFMTVILYGAWTVRSVLGDLFFLFIGLVLLLFIMIALIEVRHRYRKRELEYLKMSHHVSSEIRVIESEQNEQVAMIEAPKMQNVQRFSEWASAADPYSFDELPHMPTTEPNKNRTNVLPPEPVGELTKAQKLYKEGATSREKLAQEMSVTNRKARALIEELKRRKLV
jgi:hypothetical protein